MNWKGLETTQPWLILRRRDKNPQNSARGSPNTEVAEFWT